MFGIVRLIFRTLRRGLTRPRPSKPVSGNSRDTIKKKALSEADVRALLEGLPKAKVIHVMDGDTLIVAKGWSQIMIRLDSIDCPEDGQHWGDIAAYGLIKLVGGRRVVLEEHGLDFHGRTLATIYVPA